ncbi:hypothetical protein LCGC14_1244310 [marine sediment metagenome]|uniref:Uncharacterized protein n=1 Tax=marine sediment metagenome TaxID=412755 RepID=A0A0F9P903_9ZZZZ
MSTQAYRAYVTASKGSLLLGGVTHHESHPFATSQQADMWLRVIIAENAKAHRGVAAWGWKVVEHANPIKAAR